MKRKILPITQNVRFRTYTYYSYYDAIVSNRFRTGKVAASININGFDEKKWEKKEQKLHIEHSGEGRLIFNADKYNLSMNALVYRTLKYVDEQTIEIYYQQNSQPWGSIGFFISDEVSFESDKYMHQIGRFCTGDLFYRNQQGQTNYYKSSKCIIQVKKNNKSISFWIYNEKKRRMELLKESEVNETKLYLGVYVFLYDNNYYEWVFNNYIQLKANKNATDIFLEFDNALKKDWKYFTTNYFVDYNISKLSFLMKLGIDVCKYIKRNIQSNNYVEMDIDYYDIIGTFYYRKQHYRHTCLFYGYDEVKEMFFVLCVDKNGHLKKCQIDYMSVFSELHDDSNLSLSENQDLIIVETYSPEHLPYVCSKESIGRSIKAFLQGASVICSGTIIYMV